MFTASCGEVIFAFRRNLQSISQITKQISVPSLDELEFLLVHLIAFNIISILVILMYILVPCHFHFSSYEFEYLFRCLLHIQLHNSMKYVLSIFVFQFNLVVHFLTNEL